MDGMTIVPMVADNVAPQIHLGPTPPVAPDEGDFWYDTTRGFLFLWWNDGTSTQWIVANPGRGQIVGPAGGDLGLVYPNPSVVKATGAAGYFDVSAVITATAPPIGDDSNAVPTTAWIRDIVPILAARVSTSDLPPVSPPPTDGDLWWDSTLAKLFIWYVDSDSGQWVSATASGSGGSGGGGGGGDVDLDTALVAALGSTIVRTVPQWLAGPPVIICPGDTALSPDHRGAWLHMTNPISSIIQLPDDWPVGMSVGIRQMSTGPVTWYVTGDATVQLPFTRNTHVGISEQYEEMVLRVVLNSDGGHAVWGVAGSTG